MSIPTLTTDGVIKDKKYIMTKLYEYFVASKYSQSYFYKNISSLDYVISNFKDPEDMKLEIQKTLTILYSSEFNDINVVVEIIDSDRDSNYEISIDITADGYNLSKSVNIVDNNIEIFKTHIRLYK
jgi:hypothetical protein